MKKLNSIDKSCNTWMSLYMGARAYNIVCPTRNPVYIIIKEDGRVRGPPAGWHCRPSTYSGTKWTRSSLIGMRRDLGESPLAWDSPIKFPHRTLESSARLYPARKGQNKSSQDNGNCIKISFIRKLQSFRFRVSPADASSRQMNALYQWITLRWRKCGTRTLFFQLKI